MFTGCCGIGLVPPAHCCVSFRSCVQMLGSLNDEHARHAKFDGVGAAGPFQKVARCSAVDVVPELRARAQVSSGAF
jgi:hypothetical protein